MGRKPVQINPIRGERLRALLNERGMRQEELADILSYSKEHISYIVNGRRNLTPEIAEAIAQVFKPVCVEWLLGLSDYKTKSDQFAQVIDDANKESGLLHSGLLSFAVLSGYSIDFKELTTPKDISVILSNAKRAYTISRGGQQINMSLEEMNVFENEVLDFVELKLRHLFRQKGVDIEWQT